jgi:hypothetical protein
MTRIGKVAIRYNEARSPERAAAIARQAMAMIAERLPAGSTGRVGRLRVQVHVHRDAPDRAIADRIAGAVARRL